MSTLSIAIKKSRKKTGYHLRRNLSGIFILDTLPHDNGIKANTCLEDCTQATRLTWLRSRDLHTLRSIAVALCSAMQKVLDLMRPEEKGDVSEARVVDPGNDIRESWVAAIDDYAMLLHQLAWSAGISNPGSEAYAFESADRSGHGDI